MSRPQSTNVHNRENLSKTATKLSKNNSKKLIEHNDNFKENLKLKISETLIQRYG